MPQRRGCLAAGLLWWLFDGFWFLLSAFFGPVEPFEFDFWLAQLAQLDVQQDQQTKNFLSIIEVSSHHFLSYKNLLFLMVASSYDRISFASIELSSHHRTSLWTSWANWPQKMNKPRLLTQCFVFFQNAFVDFWLVLGGFVGWFLVWRLIQ